MMPATSYEAEDSQYLIVWPKTGMVVYASLRELEYFPELYARARDLITTGSHYISIEQTNEKISFSDFNYCLQFTRLVSTLHMYVAQGEPVLRNVFSELRARELLKTVSFFKEEESGGRGELDKENGIASKRKREHHDDDDNEMKM